MRSKNLLDIGKSIDSEINFIENLSYHVISIEINQYTKDYLESKGIYRFKNIPIINNNNLNNLELKINREKNCKATEYVPYQLNKGE